MVNAVAPPALAPHCMNTSLAFGRPSLRNCMQFSSRIMSELNVSKKNPKKMEFLAASA